MAIASFGNQIFQVSSRKIYTLNDLTLSGDLNIEDQEVEGTKPSTYIKGINLQEASFYIDLKSSFNVNVSAEIQKWCNIRDSKNPYMLIVGGKPWCRNRMLLTSISVDNIIQAPNGIIVAAKITLNFKEFVRWGKKKEDSKNGKKEKKRKNKNKDKSKAKGVKMNKSQEAKVASLEKSVFGS